MIFLVIEKPGISISSQRKLKVFALSQSLFLSELTYTIDILADSFDGGLDSPED